MTLRVWELRRALEGCDDDDAVLLSWSAEGHAKVELEADLAERTARTDLGYRRVLAIECNDGRRPCECREECEECGGSGTCRHCDDGDCSNCDGTGRLGG